MIKISNEKKKITKHMENNAELFLLTKKAMPKVYIDVLKVKDLISTYNYSVSMATKEIGISRTTYYKYINEIFYFNEVPNNKIITIEVLIIDKIGLLSKISNIISKNDFNINTINQPPPLEGKNIITVSMLTKNSGNLSNLIYELKQMNNVKNVIVKSIE